MEKEFNLSECILKPPRSDWINIYDVKEFIKRLKECLQHKNYTEELVDLDDIFNLIDKLAGDKLI